MFSLPRACVALFATALLTLPLAAQSNGGFESGLSNWTAIPASATTISTNQLLLFPSEGSQYAVVSAANSQGAVAGYGPFTPGGGVGQVSLLSRGFVRPAGSRCRVSLDWTFVSREEPDDATRNDFLSINILDGNTGTFVKNVVFVDNGTLGGTPAYNGVPGSENGVLHYVRSRANSGLILPGSNPESYEVAPSGFKRVQCDISSETSVGQNLILQIVVGNGGDAGDDSYAYIDNFELRSGAANSANAGLRVLGDQGNRFHQNSGFAEGQYLDRAPYRFKANQGSNATLAFAADPGPRAFAMLAGTFKTDATLTPIGELNLVQSQPINAIIDGLSPSSPIEALLGTIGEDERYLDFTVPTTSADFTLGLQMVVANPAAGPFFVSLSAATEFVVESEMRMPVGDQLVGGGLTDDDSGIVDLGGLNNGLGFPFYGTNYTECYVNSNGNITFGSGDADFTESVPEFYSGEPRIAPFWHDFDPSTTAGGVVRFGDNAGGGFFPTSPTRVVISWERLPTFSQSVTGNNFSAVLYQDGTIEFHYDALSASSGIVGISPGSAILPADPNSAQRDFSSLGSYHEGRSFSPFGSSPFFEYFEDDQDVMSWALNGRSTLVFRPIDSSLVPYRAFCGNGAE